MNYDIVIDIIILMIYEKIMNGFIIIIIIINLLYIEIIAAVSRNFVQ
jgi:hypothetical protein